MIHHNIDKNNGAEYKCDIVIPVYNSPRQVRACVESLLNTIQNDIYRMIVINDSSDGFTSRYLRTLKNIELVENKSNLGFLESANKGLLFSRSEYVCLLNSDIIGIDARWLDKMIFYADRNPEVGLISPLSNEAVNLSLKMHPGADINLMSDLVNKFSKAKYPDAVTIIGSCLLVRRSLIDKIGAFDESFGKGYCEESDYHYKAREAGFSCKIADNIFIYHEGEASFSGERDSRYSKNRELFDKKWSVQYALDIQKFNDKNELGYLRDDQFLLKSPMLHDEYDILFVLPSLETYGGVIVVVDIVNELVRHKIKANIVCLNNSEKKLEFARYFEPLYILESDITRKIPKSKIYVATHYRTSSPVFFAAHKHKAKALYLIQDDERLFENEDTAMVDASYSLIPNHIYVANWLENDIGKNAVYKKVIGNGIYRDLFYPSMINKSEREAACKKETIITMMTRRDTKRGFYEGITAINRLLANTHSKDKYFFHFFGNREVLSHEINTEKYKYHGVVDRTKVAGIMRNTDIFIDPSHFQGFGLPALEAISSGCACIMPAKGGGDDFVTHLENAVFFNGGNVDHLYQRLQLLIDCVSFRNKLQKNGSSSLSEKFSIYNSVKQYMDIIKNWDLLPDLPDFESIEFLKCRLIVEENKNNNSIRKDVQINHLKNELDIVRKRLHHYMDLYKLHKDDD
jgi:GT2 family glycosyltransferase